MWANLLRDKLRVRKKTGNKAKICRSKYTRALFFATTFFNLQQIFLLRDKLITPRKKELAQAVCVMKAQKKRIYMLMLKVKKKRKWFYTTFKVCKSEVIRTLCDPRNGFFLTRPSKIFNLNLRRMLQHRVEIPWDFRTYQASTLNCSPWPQHWST